MKYRETIALEKQLDLIAGDVFIENGMTRDQVRELVTAYYRSQEERIRIGNQISALERDGKPSLYLKGLYTVQEAAENYCKKLLDYYSEQDPVGQWARAIRGIGPVITSGLLAHLDWERAASAASFWKYAGLCATTKWEKGQKRPWNAELKRLCFIIGTSFEKQSPENSLYKKIYCEYKEKTKQANEAGAYAERAAECVKIFSKTTESYKAYAAGKLPDGHIRMMSIRYCVKLFLSHLFDAGCVLYDIRKPPVPYAIQFLGHVHQIEPEVLYRQFLPTRKAA